jgi:hypothetical protein
MERRVVSRRIDEAVARMSDKDDSKLVIDGDGVMRTRRQ